MDEDTTTDIPTLVENMRNHRFDGYSPVLIAGQIDWIREGVGTGSINAAVDALQQVGTALTETEDTLHTELGKLGVSWHGSARVAAGAVVAEEAGFAGTTAERLQDVARALFAQADAFNRTRAKLPDAEQVRRATGETNLGDDLLSLIGFETDHASRLARAKETWHYAVQVLNEYCMESAEHLESTQAGAEPRAPEFSLAGQSSTAIGVGRHPAGGNADGLPMAVGAPVSASTGAAGAAGSTPTPEASTPAPSGYTNATPSATFTPGSADAAESPPTAGFVAPTSSGGAQASGYSSTSTSGVAMSTAPPTPATPATNAGHGGLGGSSGRADAGQPTAGRASGGESVPPTSEQTRGRVIGRVGVPAPGAQSPAGGIGNRSYTPLNPVAGGATGPETSLARGRMSGLLAQSAPEGGYAGGAPAPRASSGMSATDVGAGAAALGAGGVAGAMSGDSERQGGGLGRSVSGTGHFDEDEAEAAAAERIEAGENADPDAVSDEQPAAGH